MVLLVLGLLGFAVSKHIFNHKKVNATPLVCPMKFDCHAVVHSDYSTFFGVHLEVLGMIYYAFISFSYFLLISIPKFLPAFSEGILLIASLVAFLFSIYLICVQIFVLKKGCFWCFISAFISILIFTISIYAYGVGSVIEFFSK